MQESKIMETQSSEVKVTEINNETGTITTIQASQPQDELAKYGEMVSNFLASLPEYLGNVFNRYKQPLTVLGLIVGAIVTLKVVLAILDALNDIPLVAPTFELIGIGYSAWFVYRYLLKSSTRKELTTEIATLKTQVVGKNTPQT
jgi:hypothetical protein